MAIWCIGFFAIGFAAIGFAAAGFAGAAGALAAGAAGAAAGGDDGVIGAFCAQTGAAIARAAAMATPVKRCFMFVVLCGSSGFDTTATAAVPEGGPCEPSVRNNATVVSFRRTRNRSFAYPTLPVPDNIYPI
jgi:hypothetical protein